MLLVVLWCLRYKLSVRDLVELVLVRGFVIRREAGREWQAHFAPLIMTRLRAKRRGQAGPKWRTDEPYVEVAGSGCSRHRARDRDGNLVEALPRDNRGMAATQQLCAHALDIAGHAPERVATGGHDACPRGIRGALGPGVSHRASRSL